MVRLRIRRAPGTEVLIHDVRQSTQISQRASVRTVNTVLLLVDIQNDYFPGGRMELHHAEEAGARAADLLTHFRDSGHTVIHVRHVATKPGATFFLPDTDGVGIHHSVSPTAGEVVITKHFPNSFRETDLQRRLEEARVTDLVIVGMMTHMCIDSTTRAAFDAGFRCEVAGDACATREQTYGGVTIGADAVHSAFLAALSGTFARVGSTDEILSRH